MSRQDGENARRPSASPLTYRRESETLDVDVTATGQSQEGEEGGLRSDLRMMCVQSAVCKMISKYFAATYLSMETFEA